MKGTIAELAEKVRKALPEFKDNRLFSGHLTIARVKANPEKLADNLQKLGGIEIGKQLVNEFKLKNSTLTREGPVYEDVRVFELK